jgi:hypothetical protein
VRERGVTSRSERVVRVRRFETGIWARGTHVVYLEGSVNGSWVERGFETRCR